MIPIAICTNRLLGYYVGGFRVLDENGMGTDEVLFCETPVRRSRAMAIADAMLTLQAQEHFPGHFDNFAGVKLDPKTHATPPAQRGS